MEKTPAGINDARNFRKTFPVLPVSKHKYQTRTTNSLKFRSQKDVNAIKIFYSSTTSY